MLGVGVGRALAATVDPLVSDSFEGSTAGNAPTSVTGLTWSNGGAAVRVSDTIARTGSKSLRFRFGPDPDYPTADSDSTAEQRFEVLSPVAEVWVEFWVYLGSGANPYVHRTQTGEGVNNKLLRLWFDDGTEDSGYRYTDSKMGLSSLPDAGGTRVFPEFKAAEEDGSITSWTGAQYSVGVIAPATWTRVRVHAKLPTDTSGDGVFEACLGDDWSARKSFTSVYGYTADCVFDRGYLMGWANSGFTAETDINVDDVKIYDESPGWA